MKTESLAKKAVQKKSSIVKIFVRICVFLMAFSLIGVYVAYMFTPASNEVTVENNVEILDEVITGGNNEIIEILPENVDAENPELSAAPIVMSEDGEINEMNQEMQIVLENGDTETIKLGDLSDSLQVN